MEKGTEILNGHFRLKSLPDGGVDRTKVICNHCKGEFSYHRSTLSLKYHLNAIHTIDASKSPTQTKSGGRLQQTTLDAACGRSIDKQKQDKLTNAIAKWIATNCRPISIVEDVGLRNVLRIGRNDGTYEPPSRRTVARRIHELYEMERTTKATALQRALTVALTGDYWTSLGNDNYLGVTVHYIDELWELHSHALTVLKIEERHFIQHFIHVVQQWNISNKVSTLSTDSARNMIAAARHLPFEHIPCVAHSLQRSVTVSLQNIAFDNILAKCRKVVGHFKHSPASAAELEHQQIEHGQKKEMLIQDVPTRWNSTLNIIKNIRRNEQPLRDVLTTHNTKLAMPTRAEMDKLQKLEMLLEPCRYVTELLGGEKYVSCSVVLPAFCHLSRMMESSDEDPAYVVKFKSAFRTDLEKRKENANIAYLKIATALDPRFKGLKFINILKEQRVVAEKPVEATASEPPTKKLALLAASSESDSEQEEDSVENSVRRYRAEPTISTEACPLEWWSKHAGSHSKLACIAQKYLATPATSVPCERLFSLAGHIVQKKRVSLSSENVNELVCLSNWIGAKEKKNVKSEEWINAINFHCVTTQPASLFFLTGTLQRKSSTNMDFKD
uniref:HAT C-terminal dimerisation domain-containing protein n=1 Tax=Paramormyrops kingsleyae TaxID=1676925 RepID=A0A3B3QSC0_9TELE